MKPTNYNVTVNFKNSNEQERRYVASRKLAEIINLTESNRRIKL